MESLGLGPKDLEKPETTGVQSLLPLPFSNLS